VSWLAREATVRRVVDGAVRGRAPVILGGPGMGRTTVVNAAAGRLRAQGVEVAVLEIGDESAELGVSRASVTLRTGGLALHREIARGRMPLVEKRTVQRIPLVPLLRRDLRAWAAAAGFALPEDDLERAFRASGGHPAVFAAWLDAHRISRSPAALERRVLVSSAELFARIDRELAHPELAKLWAWLAERGSASVREMQRATGATKAALDRLTLAGPVSRTLGSSAEIAVTCESYLSWARRG
jgi:hypothetical protein